MVLSIICGAFIWLVSLLLSQLIINGLLEIEVPGFISMFVGGIINVAVCYFLLKLLFKKYIKEDMGEYLFSKEKIAAKWLIVAFVLPFVVSGIFLLMNGSFVQNDIETARKLTFLSYSIFVIGFGTAIVEEMIFRGLIMNLMKKRYNLKVAVIVHAFLFAATHLVGMKFDFVSYLLVLFAGTLVGIMFSLIALDTKSIWNSAIVHWIWNTVNCGTILIISASANEDSIFNYILETKSPILTGGEYSIETSIISILAYSAVCLFAFISIRKRKNNK